MTLIELGFILLIPTTFVAVAVLLLDAPLSFALLIAFGMCAFYVLTFVVILALAALYLYFDSWRTGRPYIPPCESCGGLAFTWDRQLGVDVWTCPCGRRYVRRGLQCLAVLPGGATTPYRRWRPFRRWVDDRAAIAVHVPAPYRGSDLPA